MKIYRESDADFAAAVAAMNRRAIPTADVRETVTAIIDEVQAHGDAFLDIDDTEPLYVPNAYPPSALVSSE